jgi:hypothetical protein
MRAAIGAALVLGLSAVKSAAGDLPAVGRSLFDHMTTRQIDGRNVQQVPYPFAALLAEIESRAGTDTLGQRGVAAVLIPLGRSLQRNASAGAYFAHPRVVVAVTGEARTQDAPWLLKDRLFLGFQDEAGVIEVISYNEAAGRFEFQVVTGYRRGAIARVSYARRAVCGACHHAAGPIFSRPGWDETNANPVVAQALARHADRFHGVAVKRGIDFPNAIDDAVARANRLALGQTLWQQGCDAVKPPAEPVACRQALLAAVLERKLGGVRHSAADAQAKALAPLLAAWKSRWPGGLPEPDPNIPNRDPFFGQAQQLAAGRMQPPWGAEEITPALDPMTPRAPVRAWRPDATGVQLLLHTLGSFFAESDLRALEMALGGEGVDSRLARAMGAIAAATRAGRTDALASAPFRRTALLHALGAQLQAPLARGCCDAPAPAFDAPQLEGPAPMPQAIPQPLTAFYTHCAACHATPAESPPGFLHGSLEAVERQLARCAPRIAFRLAMWERASGERPKVPMPPPVFVPGWDRAAPRADLDAMTDYVRRVQAGRALEPVRGRGYESLPPCREPSSGGSAAAGR